MTSSTWDFGAEHDQMFPASRVFEVSVDKRGLPRGRLVFWLKTLIVGALDTISMSSSRGVPRPVWLVVTDRESGECVYRSGPIELLEDLRLAQEKLEDDLEHLDVGSFRDMCRAL